MKIVDSLVSRWDDEARLCLLPEWSSKLEYRAYELPKAPQMENGGLEFEIILNKKPDTNVFAIPIETQGLRFLYQPLRVDPGCQRPDNVKGSYAVYHESRAGDFSKLGGKNYMAGKAFHIYRPNALDAKGRFSWGSIRIDKKAGMMFVTMPQEFLANATYPVIIDPTIGKTNIGGSGGAASSGSYYGSARAQAGAVSGTSSKVSVYGQISSDSTKLRLGYYTDKAGPFPDALVGADNTGVDMTPADLAWVDSGAIETAVTASAYYWVCFHPYGVGGWAYRYDTLADGLKYRYSGDASLPATFAADATNAARNISMYVTYEEAASTNIVLNII